MGLDTVELVMDIEEAFDISIPDERASRMMTVGDVYEFILERTTDATLSSNRCITAGAFYELRRHCRSIGFPIRDFRPRSKIDSVVPLIGRRFYWNALASRMEVRFPSLARPSWLTLLICTLAAGVAFSVFGLYAKPNVAIGIAYSVILGVAIMAILVLLTKPFAIYPPSTCSTVRDLVTNIVAINYHTLAKRYSTRNPTDIWNALQLIVAEQLGVDRSKVVPTARFVQDLGAD